MGKLLAGISRYLLAAGPAPLFAYRNGAAVAFLRFRAVPHPEGLAGRCVDVSLIVAPEARGRGLGRQVLQAAADVLKREGIDTLLAEIRPENDASRRAFAAAGFVAISSAIKHIADTGEDARIERHVLELVPPFWRNGRVRVIAEAGSNWRMGTPARDRAMARGLVDVAIDAGADAVKFQTYRPETVYVANAGQANYLDEAGIKEDISEIFRDLAMPYDLAGEIADYCQRSGIAFMSTPFSPADFAAIDPLVSTHKIASYEIGHPHLIDLAAASGKPVVMSTGATTPQDIAWGVNRFLAAGGRELCLMQCTAKYPAPLAAMNLATLPWLRRTFGVSPGLSDHSRDPVTAPVGAVALGARCIEKHFTLHKSLPGPDHAFALAPDELKLMVRKIREAEEALGDGIKTIAPAEQELAAFARRGVQAIRPIERGDVLREDDNIAVLRPGKQPLGVHARALPELIGRRATRSIAAGEGVRPGDWE
jgi:N-acetylneuraminate synthase